MKVRIIVVLLILSVICLGLTPGAGAAKSAKSTQASKAGTAKAASADVPKPNSESKEKQFHLKPGAEQKVCITCHPAFEDILKKKFVHTPVKTPGCTACHNPHTSNHPKQLAADVSKLCLTCHAAIMPPDARSTHKVALEGKCVQCHDPHASDNKNNLRKEGNELCYDCHKEKGEEVQKAKFKHSPVEKGCINCHNPHASSKATALLSNEVPALCKSCHDTNKPVFVKAHANYPVQNSKCTMCHDVHGSDRAGIIYSTAHKPFVNKQCVQCHDSPTSANPLALKKKGFELCRGCHNNTVNDMFSKNRLHWAVIGKKGCLNCHNPHASKQESLLNKKPIPLCGTCHSDTIQRQERSVTKHEPIKDGMCMLCHSPHASDNVFLTLQASMLEFCGTCHDYQKHSTHPVGEKIIDKRNKNLNVDCLSCHRAHGTEFKRMLPFVTVSDLCIQCHTKYQR
jgi:DmsE family decaheme c-type cytochrome